MQQIKNIFKWGLIISLGIFILIFPITNGYIAFGITWFLNTLAQAIDILFAQIILYGAYIIEAVGAVMVISFLMLVYMSTHKELKYPKKDGKITGKLKAGSLIED